MAQFRNRDNTRETFTGANSTTITLGGAAQNSRSFSGAGYSSGDTFFGTARGGAEICVGLFTYNGATVAQTTPKYSSNSNAAVSFSSGNACEVFNDIPAYVAELLNLTEISVASATTCDIGGTAVEGAKVVISGTVTITSLGAGIDKLRFVRFSGILTLTHNGTSLILPGAANITTAAGDTAIFLSDSSGNWRCHSYVRAAGAAGFYAHKNGTDQTGMTTGNYTKVTFGTEKFDIGGFFDTTNSRWTPPAGRVQLNAHLFWTANCATASPLFVVKIVKNGVTDVGAGVGTAMVGFAGFAIAGVSCVDNANGTDYYEVHAYGTSVTPANDLQIDGNAAHTHFSGAQF